MRPNFGSLSLSPSLLAVLGELGFDEPTAIQSQCIPDLLAGLDLVGQSKTGSGKTAAFALPILHKIKLEVLSPQALIMCPTRELSTQVTREIRTLGRKHKGLQVLTIVGGEHISGQANALERGVHIVVGTPGRLLDHLKRSAHFVQAVSTVVLDEADRMLDMGFQADVETILDALPPERQTVFFSATYPEAIETMSHAHQRAPVRVTVDEPKSELPQIRQLALAANANHTRSALYWVLGEFPHESALIFCNFKKSVAELTRSLIAAGLSVDCLHGDLDQFHRDQVLARFRNGSIRILIATDVAARGIDVLDLDLVINYELPSQPDVYVHRIGRTGRAGKSGISVAIVSPRDNKKIDAIEKFTGTPVERLPKVSSDFVDIEGLARPAKMATILISGGRKDKVRPGDILGALTGEACGLEGSDIGKIEIQDRLTYVAVAQGVAEDAARALNAGRIKGKRFRATLI